MFFVNKMSQLREGRGVLQRQLSADLEIDTLMYSKIERNERPAKRKQITVIAMFLQINENERITLWFADKIIATIGADKEFAGKAFKVVQENTNKI
ncbi:MAG: helix-turn-helix domain-containing protein [Tannerella sp.]|jgi:transcriptional regulator with XRE-family HTH domain|nr:helix-turn-helix domain-containing protein [Tannerella sp.]